MRDPRVRLIHPGKFAVPADRTHMANGLDDCSSLFKSAVYVILLSNMFIGRLGIVPGRCPKSYNRGFRYGSLAILSDDCPIGSILNTIQQNNGTSLHKSSDCSSGDWVIRDLSQISWELSPTHIICSPSPNTLISNQR